LRPVPSVIGEISHRETGLPVMPVHDIRDKTWYFAQPMRAATHASAPKRNALSGQSWPSGPEYGLPAVKQMRRVKDEKIKTGNARGHHPCSGPKEVVNSKDLLSRDLFGLAKGGFYAAYPGNRVTNLDAVPLESPWQRAGDISKSAGFYEWVDFRGDCENLDAGHQRSLSIMGCVIKQMPLSERRNRQYRFRILADDKPGGNPNAAIDDHVFEPDRSFDFERGRITEFSMDE